MLDIAENNQEEGVYTKTLYFADIRAVKAHCGAWVASSDFIS